ncbi:MAG TPA: UDP-N-acetylmuramoyl-L-alanyl-D-glutamate--2,6-diaminopimelate ligase [bacterium]|nr:UDP-N-acetylmuramoyl-L-alanyl-D-glutamate--2,6-diaminopimelate ligase [bacterium]
MKTLRKLFEGLIPLDGSVNWDAEVTDVVSDSRQAGPGILFIAIPGFETDGHDYIPDALERGASVIVSEKQAVGPGALFIRVPDTRGIQALIAARFFDFPAERLGVHGITGTNGKTTSAYLMESVLRHCGFEPGLIGTVRYRWKGHEETAVRTTPDAIDIQRLFDRMAREGVRTVAMEVSSHALDLRRVDGIPFRTAIFTNLTHDHLDYHGTIEAYAEAKSRLFGMIRNGIGVVNGDDPGSETMIRSANGPVVRFGIACEEAEYRIRNIRESEAGSGFSLGTPSGPFPFFTPLWGRFNVYNAAGVAAAALAHGYDPRCVAEGIRAVGRIPGRMEGWTAPAGFRIVVDYAHTPDALENVLKTARAFTAGRLIMVFGCGGDRDRGKRPVMGRIASELSDRVFVTSDNPRTEDPEAILRDIIKGMTGPVSRTVVPDRRAAIHAALDAARGGDTVIIAGKGHESYQEIGGVRYLFDDREVAEAYLS